MAIERMDRTVTLRMTDTQAEKFRDYADREGMRISAWLRSLAEERTRHVTPRGASDTGHAHTASTP